jgi:cysteine desulfurase
MLYFDYCATTPPDDEVVQAMTDVMKQYYGNPSSIHQLGVQAERLVAKARGVVAAGIGCRPEEIVFTSGGTESNNLAVIGAALRYKERGRHIIVSRIEHASVYESARRLESLGNEVTWLDADHTGAVSVREVEQALRDDTVLVSVMYVNNETGRIQPIREIGRLLADRPKTLFHVDGVQAIGKLDVTPHTLGIDLMSGSAHKLRGPKGSGFLYVRSGVELEPILLGGGQEGGMRSGTENVPAIVGMAKAVRLATEARERNVQKLYKLRKRLVHHLLAVPQAAVTGAEQDEWMAPQLVHFCLPGYRAEVIVHALEKRGICISTRSACASGETEPSRVLLAMGYDQERAASGLRISFSAEHTEEEIDFLFRSLREAIEQYGQPEPRARRQSS